MAQDKSVELSKHETDVLLGLYSGCECLWNAKNPDYKDKKIRVGAIRTIINGMRLETGKDFSTSQMQTALDNIYRKYSQELQQVIDGESTPGNGFKSQWRWFHFLDSFLRDNVLHAQKMGIEMQSGSQDSGAHNEDDGNDTDDYFCATVDSGEEDTPPSSGKRRTQMQVLPSQPRSSSTSSSSRPVRSSSRRLDASALINGSSYSAGLNTADSQSSRKRRREAAVSQAISGRSSWTGAAAAASGSSASHSRYGGGSSGGGGGAYTRKSKTGGQAAAGSQGDSLRISSQIADTLKAVQVLLATSLTDQDQPAMVFARHLANELQQISDYGQRKQCMLDLQQVILRYQTKQQQQPMDAGARIKFEGRCEHPVEEEVATSKDSRAGSRASATATQQQCAEEPLLLYFDTP